MNQGASLKNTLTKLESVAREIQEDILYSKREVQMLRQEKEQL